MSTCAIYFHLLPFELAHALLWPMNENSTDLLALVGSIGIQCVRVAREEEMTVQAPS